MAAKGKKKAMKESDHESLTLESLGDGMRGMDDVTGLNYARACAVCLEEAGHPAQCIVTITGSFARQFLLIRPDLTDQIRSAHADLFRATEDGSCGLAILVVAKLTNLEVLRQSSRKNGFDYVLVPRGSFLFQNRVRLEVTGTRTSKTERELELLVEEKRRRFDKFGDQGIPPAIIVVVDFGRPLAHVVRL
ncbi:MAG TPA: hypothetical protein VJ725_30835 [Thermoanaerobaculia bacterium]|nr:hypothetical protein [Thermoanaerobaculia bacterium]